MTMVVTTDIHMGAAGVAILYGRLQLLGRKIAGAPPGVKGLPSQVDRMGATANTGN